MTRRSILAGCSVAVIAIGLQCSGDSAHGQGAGSLVAITAAGGPVFAVDAAGGIYSGEGCFGNLRPFSRIGQLPAGATPTCISSWSNGQAIFIGCSNGDIYSFAPFAIPPVTPGFCGNVLGGSPTPATRSSWGSLKAGYR